MEKEEVKKILVDEILELNLKSIEKALSKQELFLESTTASLELIWKKLGKVEDFFTGKNAETIEETKVLCTYIMSKIKDESNQNICECCNDARLRAPQIKLVEEKTTIIKRNVEKIVSDI